MLSPRKFATIALIAVATASTVACSTEAQTTPVSNALGYEWTQEEQLAADSRCRDLVRDKYAEVAPDAPALDILVPHDSAPGRITQVDSTLFVFSSDRAYPSASSHQSLLFSYACVFPNPDGEHSDPILHVFPHR